MEIQDNETIQATLCLMNELAQRRASGETEGWLSSDDIKAHFHAKVHEE